MSALAVDFKVELNRNEKRFLQDARDHWPGSDVHLLTLYRHFARSNDHKPRKIKASAIVDLIHRAIFNVLKDERRRVLDTLANMIGRPFSTPRIGQAHSAIEALRALVDTTHSAAKKKTRRPVAFPLTEAAGSTVHAFNLALRRQEASALANVLATSPKTTAKDLADLIRQNPNLGTLSLAEVLAGVSIKSATGRKRTPRVKAAGPGDSKRRHFQIGQSY